MDQAALIDLVRQYEFLYNKRHIEYKNKNARENAWTTISSIMECKREEAETAWTSLRNRYVTERRKLRQTPSGSEAQSEWRFFSLMSFLEEHVSVRKTFGNVETLTASNLWSTPIALHVDGETNEENGNETPEEPVIANNIESESVETFSEDSAQTQTPTHSSFENNVSTLTQKHNKNIYKMKRRKLDDSDLVKTISSTLGSIKNYIETPEEEEDEDTLFGKSIAFSLKQQKNRKTKARIKIEIYQILEKYEAD